MTSRPVPRKVVLATFGTLGNIYPFIGLATRIRARGFEAVLAAPESYRAAIQAEGLGFAPIRPQVQDVSDALGVDVAGAYQIMLTNPHFILDEIYMRFLRETYEDVLVATRDADVILTHSLLVGAHLVAEKLGLPNARVALAPLHLQSATSPSLTPSAPYLLRPCFPGALPYNRLVRRVVRTSVTMRMKHLHRFRATVGLPRSDEDLFLDFGRPNRATRVFGMFSPKFAPPQPDQPRNLRVVGFPFFEPIDPERSTLSAELQSFLDEGSHPIVFTLGSFAPAVSGDFYDVSILAARALALRCVLLAGDRDVGRLKELAGPDVSVCVGAPHGLLFPRCVCVVHHGGIGTTAEAMRSGKPQVVVPFFGDQPDNGGRVRRLGIGVSLDLSRYSESRAVEAVRCAMQPNVVRRAEAMSASVQSERGADDVADWVERLGGDRAAA